MTSCVSSSETSVVTHADTPLTCPPNGACTSDHETPTESATSTATSTSIGSGISAAATANANPRPGVLADLLVDLPGPERREVIASLPPADRATVARLIIRMAAGW